MQIGTEVCSGVNPHALYQDLEGHGRAGFLRSGGLVNCPVNVETLVLSFRAPGMAVRLARYLMCDSWAGSPFARLFVRSNGALLETYYEFEPQDVNPDTYVGLMNARIPADELCEISFLNLTDSGAARPLIFTVSGWLEDQRDVA